MLETPDKNLGGVAETAFITLYLRAMESRRPDALVKDERAEAVVRQLDQEYLQKMMALTEDAGRVVMILKSREFDRFTRDFLARFTDAAVVHIGCGFDTRFERVDNGQVQWYDLDLPEVITQRRKLIGGEGKRYHLLGCSVFDEAWLEAVKEYSSRPFLFLAEGVFMYFNEAQVRNLVLTLMEHFPGAELVFDAYSPFMRWAHNFKVTRTGVGVHLQWALKNGRDLESWDEGASVTHEVQRSAGVRLLDERFPFQSREPRLRRVLKVHLVPFLARGIGVFHYQL